MFKITFYVPVENKEDVKRAMFQAQAGKIGSYDCCSFEMEGIGQYRPLEGSNPYVGEKYQVEKVSETRVEMVCQNAETVKDVISAMKKAHPYETVAYDVIKIENF